MTLATLQKPTSRAADKVKDKAEKAKRLRAVQAFVDKRDKWQCRACGRRVSIGGGLMEHRAHRHHIAFRSKGGHDTTANIVLLCGIHHHEIHAYRMTVTGEADGRLTFSVEGRKWFSDPPK